VNGIFIFYQRAMKQKHNWEELKNKYLVSPIMEVAEFIRQELGTNK
jgi:hypothetical protein